ncbi:hypothetical protein [Paenirhodobacter populi]|nr:hypothetical protein [Sinirhodobacter populi]
MHKDLPAIFTPRPGNLLHDALGALSICVTFVGVLYLPGLF